MALRKRRLSCGSDDGQVPPWAKRAGGQPQGPEPGRDVWDSGSSSSESSGLSSPERPAGGSSVQAPDNGEPSLSKPSPTNPAPFPEEWAPIGQAALGSSYQHINRILREAHFSSLLARGHAPAT